MKKENILLIIVLILIFLSFIFMSYDYLYKKYGETLEVPYYFCIISSGGSEDSTTYVLINYNNQVYVITKADPNKYESSSQFESSFASEWGKTLKIKIINDMVYYGDNKINPFTLHCHKIRYP